MLQYFYLVYHLDSEFNRINDKIFLQEEKAINWGRRQATKDLSSDYMLQRCPITTSGIIRDYKTLTPFKSEK